MFYELVLKKLCGVNWRKNECVTSRKSYKRLIPGPSQGKMMLKCLFYVLMYLINFWKQKLESSPNTF